MSNRPELVVLLFLVVSAVPTLSTACQSAPQTEDSPKPASATDDNEADKETGAGELTSGTKPSEVADDVPANLIRVGVSDDAIRVDGESVVALTSGTVDKKHKKGGENGLEIEPLRDALLQKVEALSESLDGAGPDPKTRLEAAPYIRYRTVTEILFTAGQAGVIRNSFEVVSASVVPSEPDTALGAHSPELPTRPPNGSADPPDKKPLNLTVAVGTDGFRVAATGAILPPRDGCPKAGPTFCLLDPSVDVETGIKRARRDYRNSQAEKGRKRLEKTWAAYDLAGLYNQLVRIKKHYPDETQINVTADSHIPIHYVVKTANLASRRLPKDSYDGREAVQKALDRGQFGGPLFPNSVLSVVK